MSDLLHRGELHLGDGRARPAPDVGHQILGRPAVTSHLMQTLLIYLLLYVVNGTVGRRPHFIVKFREFLLTALMLLSQPEAGCLGLPLLQDGDGPLRLVDHAGDAAQHLQAQVTPVVTVTRQLLTT